METYIASEIDPDAVKVTRSYVFLPSYATTLSLRTRSANIFVHGFVHVPASMMWVRENLCSQASFLGKSLLVE